MNNVQLVGRATKEPEEIGKMIRFTLAVDRKFKKEGQPTADFINCIAFGKTGETIQKYMVKGQKYAVIGRIQTGSYTNKDNQKIHTSDVVVESFEFVESKGGKSDAPSASDPVVRQEPPVYEQATFVNVPDELDLDVPFV